MFVHIYFDVVVFCILIFDLASIYICFQLYILLKYVFYFYTDGEIRYQPGGTKDGIIATRSGRDDIFPLCNRSDLISLYTYILLPIFEYFSSRSDFKFRG